jgi:hypothetical protein
MQHCILPTHGLMMICSYLLGYSYQLVHALGDFVAFTGSDHVEFGHIIETKIRLPQHQVNIADTETIARIRTNVNQVCARLSTADAIQFFLIMNLL